MKNIDDILTKVLTQLGDLSERVKQLEQQEVAVGFGLARVWVGLITTTIVPTITINEILNGFSGVTFSGSNVGAGLWNITSSSPVLTTNKTTAIGGLVQSATGQMASLSQISTSVIRLSTFSAPATPADQALSGIPVIILAWP